jgi:hypothetical protein
VKSQCGQRLCGNEKAGVHWDAKAWQRRAEKEILQIFDKRSVRRYSGIGIRHPYLLGD